MAVTPSRAQQTAPADPLVTPEQFAEQVQEPVTTVNLWRWRRKGPDYIKIHGRHVRYRQSAIDAWLAAQPTGER